MTTSSQIEFIVNGESSSIPAGSTVSDLLVQLEIRSRAIAIEINQQIVPGDQFENTIVKTNDEIEIVTLVGGG